MEIKYSKKKEEMRHDPVMESLLKARKYYIEHNNLILSVVIAAVVVFAGFSGYAYIKKTGQQRASEAFGKAMMAYSGTDRTAAVEALSLVAEKHRGSLQASYSAFLLGQMYLEQEDYKEAITWLDIAARNSAAGLVSGQALELLALCYEATEDYQRAAEYIQKALKSGTVDFKAPALKWKAALVSRKLGNKNETQKYCREILSDTLAGPYQQKAGNLLTEMDVL